MLWPAGVRRCSKAPSTLLADATASAAAAAAASAAAATAAALQRLHAQSTIEIIDETDAYLDPRVQLIYAYGSREALPERETRCEMASELLHQVASNAAVEALLADPRVAETQAHTGPLGRNAGPAPHPGCASGW